MDLRLILNHDAKDPMSQTSHARSNLTKSAGSPTSERTTAALKKLYLSSEQQNAIRSLYTRNQEFKAEFDSSASQLSAQQLLRTHGLPEVPNLKGPLSGSECWMTASSNTWGSNTGRKKRIIFQCICGYDTAARQSRDRRGSQNPLKWTRHTDYEFRGCLAHADVTWNLSSNRIERVMGHFEHCEDCAAAPVIHRYTRELTLWLARKERDGLGPGVDFEHGSPEKCPAEMSTHRTGGFSGSPSETLPCFDGPGNIWGCNRYQ